MNLLNNFKVRTKILASYAIFLLLIIAISFVFTSHLERISTTVANLTDDLAEEQHRADRVVAQVWTLRFYADRYIHQQDPLDLERFTEEAQAFDVLLQEASVEVTDPKRSEMLDEIKKGVGDFESSFYEVVDLLDERTVIIQGTLDVQGALADLKLSELRSEVAEVGDYELALSVSDAQQSFLQIRFNTFRYLISGEDRWLSERRYNELRTNLRILRVGLEDEDLEQLVLEAREAINSYIQGIELIRASYTRQDELAAGLVSIGDNVERVGAGMSRNVTEDFRGANEALNEQISRTRRSLILTVLLAVIVGLGFGYMIAYGIVTSITALTQAARKIYDGDLSHRARVTARDEIGELSTVFNAMAEQIFTMVNTLEEQVGERTIQLERSLAEQQRSEEERLQLQQEIIEAQQHAIQQLSTPVIPIVNTPRGSIIAMPLIGEVDSYRAKEITRALLRGIGTYNAQVVILDVTGVPFVDSQVAGYFNKAVQAAALKGAYTIVTGISDPVAETLVDLGIDWSEIETLGNLHRGLIAAFERLGIQLQGKR